jgi:hypothetical protein
MHTKHSNILAAIALADATGMTVATIQIGFNAADVPHPDRSYVVSHRNDFHSQFMAKNAGVRKKWLTTMKGMDVRTTNANSMDPYGNLIGAWFYR